VNRPGLFAAALVLVGGGCTPAPQRHLVAIKGLAFAPVRLEVAAGDTIGWVNGDMFPHTSTADGAAGWDTGPIPSGDTTFAVVRRAGTFNYICEIHPTMHGTIIVR
jgi:plastocyanin